MYKRLLILALVAMFSPVVLGNIVVNDNFDDNAIGTNTNGIGTGFNTAALTGGSVTESDSFANLINTGNGAARASITSKEGAAIGSGITRFEFRGVKFALSEEDTSGATARQALGVRGNATAEDTDGGQAEGFWIQFENNSLLSASNSGGWNGTSVLMYQPSGHDLVATAIALATWKFDTLNWDTGTPNFTPVLDITLDITPSGYSLVIEGDTITLLSGSLSNTFAAAGITNNLTTGHAFVFNQTENDAINISVNQIVITEDATPPVFASLPNPEDSKNDIIIDTTFSWTSGIFANTHNLFFGTDFNDVNNATIDNHLNVTVAQGLAKDVTSFDPGLLELGTTYYWRIDEVNAPPNTDVIYKGTVWSFRTEEIAMKVPASDIVATAKNSSSKNDPNNVINELGIDPNTDRHSTSTGNWQSSTANSASDPLWIRFDFRRSYKLHQMFVWNMNNKPVAKYGFQKVRVEYLKDNDEWATLTAETTFAIASGASDYVYNTTVEFNDVVAKAVRLTMISNWDNKADKGYLSEIRFTYIPTYARLPQPETDVNNVSVDSILSWRAGREALSHSVYINTNENAVANGTAAANSASTNSYTPSLNLGRVYYWRVDEINNSMTPSKWSGDVWSFSTEEYITMEDFEDYNDFIGSLIFETWIGGDSDSTLGGSQVGHTDAPFAEETIFQSGKKSGPIYYNNTSANTSIGERSFEDTLNLTSNGADTLRLFYRGKAVTFQAAKDGSIAMSAEGSDIQGTADQFRFAYKTLTSSTGSITVRVDSIENANAWSKAGIMIRNSLEPNDVHVTAVLAANNTAEMESRSTKGGTTTAADVTNLGNPCWLKISRSGNDFTVQRSKDGTNWYSFGTDPNVPSKVTITMGSTVYIGLVVTSHTADVLAAATFYNASTTGSVSGSTWTVAPIGDIEQAEGGNTLDALYVYLTDSTGKVSAKVYAPLLSAVGSGSWMKWEIPTSYFTNVNLTKIKKISIGVGDTATPLKGKGTIFIDNIGYGHTLAK